MTRSPICDAPDLSTHNGIVNFSKVKEAGYPFVVLRAGYGKNNIDQKFVRNVQECQSNDIPVMVYWFSYAYTIDMAVNEAKYAAEAVKKYYSSCPIAFDFEYDSVHYANTKGVDVTRSLATNLAIAFLNEVKKQGCLPVLYLNRDYKKRYFDMSRIKQAVPDVKVWYAVYGDIYPSELNEADMWQYTSSGHISGVDTKVDLNKVYTNMIQCTNKLVRIKANPVVKSFQEACVKDGIKIDVDGFDGLQTQSARKKILLKASLTGVGSKGYVVRWFQSRCNEILGHNQTIDGLYGKNAAKECKLLQKKFGLNVDGKAGYDTLTVAIKN